MPDPIQGRRLPDAVAGVTPDTDESLRGGYWFARAEGVWYCGVPAPHMGIGNLRGHTVTEHDDGTITVSPSILTTTGHGLRWHGYLQRGVWHPLDDCVFEVPGR